MSNGQSEHFESRYRSRVRSGAQLKTPALYHSRARRLIVAGMQGRDTTHRQLVQGFGSLIKQIQPLEAEHPLQLVSAGLPSADSNLSAVDQPPQYSDEASEVLVLRKSLSELLKDTKKYVIEFGAQEHRNASTGRSLKVDV